MIYCRSWIWRLTRMFEKCLQLLAQISQNVFFRSSRQFCWSVSTVREVVTVIGTLFTCVASLLSIVSIYLIWNNFWDNVLSSSLEVFYKYSTSFELQTELGKRLSIIFSYLLNNIYASLGMILWCLFCYEAEEITWFSTVEETRLVTLESKYSNQNHQKYYSDKHGHFSKTYFNQN